MPIPIISGPYRTFRRLIPGESFLEFEGSTITIPMKGRRSPTDPWMEEEIKLKAFMRLEIFPPYVNNLRTREFQFIIRDWYLYGKSPMLNRLFFNDPRGFDVGSVNKNYPSDDHVPAVVTFNVANSYRPACDDHVPFVPSDIFADTKDLEIRNLTSHDLRAWIGIPERGPEEFYGLEDYVIHWQIIPLKALKAETVRKLFGKTESAFGIVFHNKPKRPGVSGFNPDNADERNRYLLALTPIIEPTGANPGIFQARAPQNRLEANRVQLRGNTVLSAIDRARRPVEIRWSLKKGLDFKTLQKMHDDAAKSKGKSDPGAAPLSGSVKIISPSRSLGTADQGPDVGHPGDSADFPARITYAINYDIWVNRERFVEDNAGIAIAVGANDVPPRDVTVAFDKPHVGHVLQQYLEFGPGHCTGMHEIPIEEFEAGCNFCRYWQQVPLDPAQTGPWQQFEDYDPNREY